jgi:peptidoglycan/xylan/chitin deacetylase (PgdA/CDA1 family)
MGNLRYAAISAALNALSALGGDRLLAPLFRGRGALLTLHHVLPAGGGAFNPNGILEITPEFLDDLIGFLKGRGYDFARIEEVPARLRTDGPPFVVLTFDDGYRDNAAYALPILRRHKCPFTLYVCTGFADATAPLWWRDLEEAVAALDGFSVRLPEGTRSFDTRTPEEKSAAFNAIYWALRSGPEEVLRAVIAEVAATAGHDTLDRTRQLCMTWDELRSVASDPLCTIGAHTLTHPMLAKHPEPVVRAELAESKQRIEAELGRDIRHLSYPVGDPTSAGPREFALARALGFETAVTTRPGVLHREHLQHLTALPRISINGLFQTLPYTSALLSGLPTLAQNRFRKLNVA